MTIKILTSYHKPCALYSSKIISPIQVGTSINGVLCEDTLHDNVGDNISDKNRQYCELTAQYWAWKNLEADYYGFMHYRRYFSFNSSTLNEDNYGNIVMPYVDQKAIEKLQLTDNIIQDIVQKYDLICTSPQDTKMLNQGKNVYEHYKLSPHHRIEDLDVVIKIIEEKYPEYKEAAKKYLKGSKAYFCNMYIMTKQLFNSYNEWLFDILEEHEKRCNFDDYDINEYRVSGFLAERLWGIYRTWLEEKKELRIKEVQKSFFKSTEEPKELTPAFSNKNIPVVLSADDKYVPYVAVTIRSIIENADKNYNYDIVILNSSITSKHQQELKNEFSNETNLSVRFFNVTPLFENVELYTHRHFTVEIYYRLLMQDIMKNYEKVLYLDSDLVVIDDLAKLYNLELNGNYVAAVQDVDSAGCYKGADKERKKYFKDFMKMKDPYAYFNSGVLLMNLTAFRDNFTSEYILNLSASKKWLFPDQDVLNILCEGHVLYLDMSWNVMMNWETNTSSRFVTAQQAPWNLYLNYMLSRKNPRIVHYAGFQKPWDISNCDYANYFWKYACQTSYYEMILTNVSREDTMTKRVISGKTLSNDPYIIYLKGMDEGIYIDGMYIAAIRKINKWFPQKSKRREMMKRVARIFFK